MESELIKTATSQGIWVTLTVALILYILKAQEKRDLKQEEREKKYQDVIFKLTEKFNVIDDVKNDVKEIKDYMFKKNK